jgi:hypothetical protein
MSKAKKDYEVGYGKPPKSGQFKKGQSGNAKGRPKGTKDFVSALLKELSSSIFIIENGRRSKVTKGRAIAKKIVNDALQKDGVKQIGLLLRLPGIGTITPEPAIPISSEFNEHDSLVLQNILQRIKGTTIDELDACNTSPQQSTEGEKP